MALKAILGHLINPIMYMIPILVAVAFLTLLERKVLGYMQFRKGPNIIGPVGLLQPVADGVKLFIKEPIQPLPSSRTLFILAPIMALTLALMIWMPISMPFSLTDINLGLLFILTISSLTVYSILASGWASNSKYALIGALRAVAQTISYEVSLGLILLCAVMFAGSFSIYNFNFSQQNTWLIFPGWPLAFMWFASTLAETNRAPFDLTEGESELVSGFNVEYAAGPFALFFLAEYANIIMINTLSVIMFMGSYCPCFPEFSTMILMTKSALLTSAFLWVRASYPRFRYDQLMHLMWKNFLPITLALTLWHLTVPFSILGLAPQY
uniref:NADH-ubiquinone oxidoreductase chain 1 n=1 Tax=Leptobrachium hainanense TaxID=461283 RepID=A9XLW9_9ANUR|nr:NADH dehydrogenase subunit 1 [Leptobrachium hainanense]